MSASPVKSDPAPRLLVRLAAALFLSYMAVALPLAALPVSILHWPGYGNGLAGLAVGIAFFSTILSRNHAGAYADMKGGRPCMRAGLALYVTASMICVLAGLSALPFTIRYAILITGRLLLGVGESLTIVGMLGWGIGLMGHERAGRVLAWTGAAMYGAFAAGGPIGLALYEHGGIATLMAVSALLPLAGLALVHGVPATTPHAGARPPFWRILGTIRWQGMAVALQGVGFAALGAFLPLRFIHAHWSHAGLGLTCFGVAFVAGRVACGHLPDRIGGLKVALFSLMIEAAGQYLLWCAPSPLLAFTGAVLTGAGCSMVYPSLGVEVVRLVPPHMRGTALGGFAAFQDLAYGATGPLAGLLADRFGYDIVFLLGGLCATGAVTIVLALLNAPVAEGTR
ncbi:MFS transporter [Komagataeibacter rhaeticus]|uniref:arabinose transporter n=1 Tax=Komagataeibacter rhaeticus TaxID=215221 RepID=UPI0004D372FA|nr:arabinose transporter [Komagataeibacter rhaeticus]KDU97168.1 membrane protein [Komagataeibacter rhaeticus AF1]MBL7239522.1 arabinose transporter [Komagataeibacter rhaeticus]PYD53514.1 MFS transporter [Komagataeibacter rhaeticus]